MSKFANLDVQQQAIARNVKADFTSNDEVRTKQASMATTDYLRLRLREDSVCRKIITPKTVNESDLDRRVEDDWPASIIDIEAQSAGAMTVPKGPPNQSNVMSYSVVPHKYCEYVCLSIVIACQNLLGQEHMFVCKYRIKLMNFMQIIMSH